MGLRARLHGSTLWWLKVGKSLQVDLGRFSTIFKRVEAIVMPFVPSLSNKLYIYIYIKYSINNIFLGGSGYVGVL